MTYAGQPAITYFFASSGGMTESIQNAFPGAAPEPWLRGVPDPYDQGPEHSWTESMSFATAAARLRGLVKGAFRGIEVLRRGYSPRIVSAYVLGSAGHTLVSGPELEERLGLDDTWAYFSVRTAARHRDRARPQPLHHARGSGPGSHVPIREHPAGRTSIAGRQQLPGRNLAANGAGGARRRHDRGQRPERGRRRRHDASVGPARGDPPACGQSERRRRWPPPSPPHEPLPSYPSPLCPPRC